MKKLMPQFQGLALVLPFVLPVTSLYAKDIYDNNGLKAQANLELVGAAIHSKENYATMGNKDSGSSSWQEAYAKYGVSFSQLLKIDSQLYGAFDLISSATWGDGDAAGITVGGEDKTNVETAYLGWKSGNLIPSLGTNGVDISVGKQMIKVGEGFLILGDMVTYGDVDLGENMSRGGAYYLASRKAFNKTAKISLGGEQGYRSDLIWLKSNNKAQSNTEVAAMTLEKVSDNRTLGLTWVHGIDQDQRIASVLGARDRRDMNTWSARFSQNLDSEQLKFSGEYAYQDGNDSSNENAWYLQATKTFDTVPAKPSMTYRYRQFSEKYDALFYGSNGSYGTWFQGEVAANYAGPFSTNTKVHHLGLNIFPKENLELGVSYFNFRTIDKSSSDYSSTEVNVFARWMIADHYFVSPLVGFLKPKKDAANSGLQLGNTDTNIYSQLVLGVFF